MNSHWKNAEPDPAKLEVLAGWKAIAGYFACNVRTVRRYEQERGLPVHRAPGKKGGTVFAYPSELDTWLESREKEQRLNLAILTSPAEQRVGDVPRTNLLWADATTLPAISADQRQAKPTSILRRSLWVFAASALLVSSVALSWQFGNHPAARATTWSQLDPLRVNQKVPARGTEDLFLRGRYFWNLRTADGLAKAIDFYTQAIVTDPSYAEAYAGLAESYDLLPQFGHADLGDSFRKAEVAADRAIELNPNLASAHRAKAFALFFWDWDIPGSDAEFQEALALDPNSAQTHQWYASTLLNRLESSDCLKQIDEALRLSPTSASVTADAAFMHEEFDPDPEAGFRRLVELEQTEPTLLSPSYFLKAIDFARGDYPRYIAELHRIASITHRADDVVLADAATRGWARGGKAGLLAEIVEVQKDAFGRGTEPGFLLGQTYVLLGRPREALPYFKASLNEHFILLMTMYDCGWSIKLSQDPGYAELFSQIRDQMHGGRIAHPPVLPAAFRLPE